MSAIDLDPRDPKAYIKAAKASDDAGHGDLALAYCQRAAELDPNLPIAYANALAYAEKATDVKADAIAWASGNLLQRDWINDGIDYHAETRTRLGKIVKKFQAAGRLGPRVFDVMRARFQAQRGVAYVLLRERSW